MRSYCHQSQRQYVRISLISFLSGFLMILAGCERNGTSCDSVPVPMFPVPGVESDGDAGGETSGDADGDAVGSSERFDAERRFATPESAVTFLMNAIRRGDGDAVDEVLSDLARKNLRRTRIDLGIPGGAGMTFVIGRVDRPGENGAQVECTITEHTSGVSGSRYCRWMVRQEPVRGWRITGVSVPVRTGDLSENVVPLDFEQMEETLLRIAAVRQLREDAVLRR
ncbi:MAG: hypothetical protein Q4C47_01890 [Planctomycetia bacterium]|nr:hypothetical protein [Planctomycetia bacterium]